MPSKIPWCSETYNPIVGCSPVSPGCTNCYAARIAHRLGGNPATPQYHGLTDDRGRWTGETRLVPSMLDKPLRWRKPRMIFVGSMTDLFHENTPFEWIAAVFGVMAACPQHTFQVFTKRPERMAEWFGWIQSNWDDPIELLHDELSNHTEYCLDEHGDFDWPLPNVWLLASIENQAWLLASIENQAAANDRIPDLLACLAAVHDETPEATP